MNKKPGELLAIMWLQVSMPGNRWLTDRAQQLFYNVWAKIVPLHGAFKTTCKPEAFAWLQISLWSAQILLEVVWLLPICSHWMAAMASVSRVQWARGAEPLSQSFCYPWQLICCSSMCMPTLWSGHWIPEIVNKKVSRDANLLSFGSKPNFVIRVLQERNFHSGISSPCPWLSLCSPGQPV